MTMFLAPYTAIADVDGSPLDAGFLYLGEYGKDPEMFPVEVFWDADFTVPAAQPIRTRNGYPVRNGSPAKVYLKTAQHSIVIKNRNSAFILVDFKNKGWDASFVVDGDKTQKQINDIQKRKLIHVLDLGMKMDGSDETEKLNEIIAGLDNCRLVIGGGNLTLSKTSLYASDYPKNDQPCVPILDKTNFQIEISPDCTINVPVHGQGAFEMMRCTGTWIIDNGSIKGAGNFPPLDGTTGRAEKGHATAGYLTSPTFYKNNSLDTSANTQGGYGGNFPQWGGGTASTWGIWNGGFIGNEGYGVLIHNDCFMCGVTGTGEIYGFNGAGVQIGFNGSYRAPSLNYPPSIACIVRGVNVHDCYHNGIQNTNSTGSLVELNTVHDIGHPNAELTDAFYDPGYGIVTSFSTGHNAVDAVWRNNNVFNCKRKGLDLHSGVNTTMQCNTVTDCWVAGVFIAQSDVSGVDTKHNKVIGNTFIRCGQAPDSNMYQSIGGVQTYALGDRVVGTEILNNTFIDCVGVRGVISVDAGKNNIVRGNTIKGSNYKTTFRFTGISAGGYGGVQAPHGTFIEGNTIEINSLMIKGITAAAGSGIVKDNTVIIPEDLPLALGIENLTSGAVWDYIGNHVSAKSGRAYIIQNTAGVSARNTETLSGTGVVGNKSTSKASEALFASVQVTFNNTATPSFTVLKGSDIIDTVVNDAYGFRVNLKNLTSTQKVFAAVERTSAEGLVSATGNANYIYTRAATYQTVVIGLQLTPASTAIEAQNITRNNVRVDIFVTN